MESYCTIDILLCLPGVGRGLFLQAEVTRGKILMKLEADLGILVKG